MKEGDLVLVPSTDYRDIRKAAFQEYAITTTFNASRIPAAVPAPAAASLGVAFVASVLSVAVSFGLDLSRIAALPGPDLVGTLKGIHEGDIPEDIRPECFAAFDEHDRVQPGEWIAIWGGMLLT